MREIKLHSGESVLVDDRDYKFLSQWKWYMGSGGYAQRTYTRNNRNHLVIMHRLILGNPDGSIDHIDGDKNNNQRRNLRLATQSINSQNVKARHNCTGFRGVRNVLETGKFVGQIGHNGRRYHLGTFISADEAARAYDQKARELYGKHAFVNFPKRSGVKKQTMT